MRLLGLILTNEIGFFILIYQQVSRMRPQMWGMCVGGSRHGEKNFNTMVGGGGSPLEACLQPRDF